MKHNLIKFGAWLLLTLGIIISLIITAFAIYLFVSYPEASIAKKIFTSLSSLIVAFIILLISLSVFESMTELFRVEKEIEEINQKINK